MKERNRLDNCGICVISLWYSPGHYEHIKALLCLINAAGYDSVAYLDSRYEKLARDDINIVYANQRPLPKANYYIVYNTSTKDCAVYNHAKRSGWRAKWLYVYHEPFKGYFETIEHFAVEEKNARDAAKTIIRHQYTRGMLKRSDMILLPSASAVGEYQKRSSRYNKAYSEFPLVLCDEADIDTGGRRQFFSFIATASKDKGFEAFLSFVEYASERDESLMFQIVTRSNISKYLVGNIATLIGSGKMLVTHGRDLEEDEIREAFLRSRCTWFAYNRSNQSGAVCKAMMYGSPVIYTPVGSFAEFLGSGCGEMVQDNRDAEEIYNALLAIEQSEAAYVAAARRVFVNSFSCSSRVGSLLRILKLVDSSSGTTRR